MTNICTQNEVTDTGWAREVDGPDPLTWPGQNYEMFNDTSGFIAPALAAKMITADKYDPTQWVEKKEGEPYIYRLDREDSPWRVRARLASDGVHADADYVQYVLELKGVAGAKDNGSLLEFQVCRGAMSDLSEALSKGESILEGRFKEFCKHDGDYRIVSSREELENVAQEIRFLSSKGI